MRDACREILGSAAPTRCFVYQSAPPDDTDEYLAVWADPVEWIEPYQSTAGGAAWGEGEMREIASLPRITLNVRCMRAAAHPAAKGRPQVRQVEAVAERCMTDAWRLVNGLRRRIEADQLLYGLTASMVGASSVAQEAGLTVGWQLVLRCTLEGYTPEPA